MSKKTLSQLRLIALIYTTSNYLNHGNGMSVREAVNKLYQYNRNRQREYKKETRAQLVKNHLPLNSDNINQIVELFKSYKEVFRDEKNFESVIENTELALKQFKNLSPNRQYYALALEDGFENPLSTLNFLSKIQELDIYFFKRLARRLIIKFWRNCGLIDKLKVSQFLDELEGEEAQIFHKQRIISGLDKFVEDSGYRLLRFFKVKFYLEDYDLDLDTNPYLQDILESNPIEILNKIRKGKETEMLNGMLDEKIKLMSEIHNYLFSRTVHVSSPDFTYFRVGFMSYRLISWSENNDILDSGLISKIIASYIYSESQIDPPYHLILEIVNKPASRKRRGLMKAFFDSVEPKCLEKIYYNTIKTIKFFHKEAEFSKDVPTFNDFKKFCKKMSVPAEEFEEVFVELYQAEAVQASKPEQQTKLTVLYQQVLKDIQIRKEIERKEDEKYLKDLNYVTGYLLQKRSKVKLKAQPCCLCDNTRLSRIRPTSTSEYRESQEFFEANLDINIVLNYIKIFEIIKNSFLKDFPDFVSTNGEEFFVCFESSRYQNYYLAFGMEIVMNSDNESVGKGPIPFVLLLTSITAKGEIHDEKLKRAITHNTKGTPQKKPLELRPLFFSEHKERYYKILEEVLHYLKSEWYSSENQEFYKWVLMKLQNIS